MKKTTKKVKPKRTRPKEATEILENEDFSISVKKKVKLSKPIKPLNKPPEGYAVYDPISGQKWKTFEDYHKYMVDNGYMKPDGEPLKCHRCENTDLESKEYIEDNIITGIKVRCKKCNSSVGYWSYGSWEV